jgi:DNA-binding NtrC family response regulator
MELWREHQSSVDLLLTDLMLPDGMSGKELAEKFHSEKADLKVIITSGYTPETLGQGFQNPNHATFLAKPFSIQMLLQAIRRVLDSENSDP